MKPGPKPKDEEYYGERAITIANNILLEAQGGFDGEVAAKSIKKLLESMELNAGLLFDEAKRLSELSITDRSIDLQSHSKAIASAVKAIDELYRLMSFAKGRPDSRPDLGNGFLQGLTDSQIEQVNKWINENQAFTKAKVINGNSQD